MRAFAFSLFCGAIALYALPAHAGTLSYVSDLISTSAPATSTVSHIIQFTTANAIPASGKIVITPESGAYTVPIGFDYTDVDVAISSGGPYSDRTLASTASATEDGVSVSGDSITITLNSTAGISAGVQVQIQLGSVATHGVAGDVTLVNPSTPDSYRISLETQTSGGSTIDVAMTIIVIIEPVSVSASSSASPPNRSNGFPSGEIEADHDTIEISLNTDEPATCRYATSSGVTYYSMTTTFTSWASSSTIHHINVSGHVNGTSYIYYVRCTDANDFANPDDYEISFSIKADPEFDTSISAGDAGPGGVGPFLGGSAYLYLSTVTISGDASPGGRITVLKDGVTVATAQVATNGTFTVTPPAFERGTYTFSTYVTDRAGRRSSSYASTMSFGQGTNNTISDIIVSPTIDIDDDSVATAETVRVFGEGVTGATIELLVDGAKKFSASTTKSVAGSPDGMWEISFPASALSRGTHILRARTTVPGRTASGVSTVILLGVGEEPNPSATRSADLNRDGKVNLVDFSILLSKWQTDDEVADINADGNVNIADFSIMLFQWTG
jgi:hypothetical protein